MIIRGNPAGNVGFWSSHLLRDDTNTRADVVEISGLFSEDLPNALREMQILAAGSRSHGNFMYQANINPYAHEHLTPEQWKEAVDTLEKNLGLEGHQRVVIEHEKEGRTHRHIIWNRVDGETLRVADMGGNYRTHTATQHELESRFDLTPTPTPSALDRKPVLELWEIRAAERSGINPATLKDELSELWRSTDSGKAFAAALDERGYVLAKGDRRDFCVIDPAGDAHSLARRLDGVKAKDVRERMADIDRDSLPTVAEARTTQRERAEVAREFPTANPAPLHTEAAQEPLDPRAAAQQEKWKQEVAAESASLDSGAASGIVEKPALTVFNAATGAADKLVDFVSALLGGDSKPPIDPATLDQMDKIKAQRKALAALESIRDCMERGTNLKPEDVENLTPTHLQNIKAKGDAYLWEMIERMERGRERERDWGRERER